MSNLTRGWRWWASLSLFLLLVLAELSQISFWALLRTSLIFTETVQRWSSNSSNDSLSSIVHHETWLQLPISKVREREHQSTFKPQMKPTLPPPIRPLRLCTRVEIQDGEWVPLTLPRNPYSPYSKAVSCDKPKEPWHTWDWQPFAVQAQTCIFQPWDSAHFCSLVRFATVAMIGDSLSWEHFASLIGLLNERVKLRRGNITNVYHVCQGQVRLVYLRSNDLALLPHLINTTSPNVLILNRGAHFVPNNVLEPELQNLTTDLKEWQHSCHVSQRPCHLFIRTTVPGHPQCWNFTKPAKTVREMEDYIAEASKYYNQPNHFPEWAQFKRQNELSLLVYERANLTYDVLDAYHINLLRPDEHLSRRNDCLHSCIPGKMDVYNQLLLHFLQRRRGGVAVENAPWIIPTH